MLRKLFQLFDKSERVRFALLVGTMLIAAAFEVAGVATILPFMSLVADPALVTKPSLIADLYANSGFDSPRRFLLVVGSVVLITITLSNASAALTTWMMQRYVARAHYRLSATLLRRYVCAPYAFFLTRNSSELAKNLLEETNSVMHGVLLPLLQSLAKATVTVAILLLLLFVDPVLAAAIALVFGGAYSIIYIAVRRRQRHLAKVRMEANGNRYKAAAEALVGIKDIKVLGREEELQRRFTEPNWRYVSAVASQGLIGQLPRYGLETVAFGSMLLIVLVLLATQRELTEVIPMISLYALAGYRLMPALQQVYNGVSQVRFYRPALDRLANDLTATEMETADAGQEPPRSRSGKGAQIELLNVTFSYVGAAAPAVADLSLTIPRCSSVAFVGETGSGKSTIADLVLGLHLPTSGSILVDGVPLPHTRRSAWGSTIGYVPQQIFLSDDSVRRNIALGLPDSGIDDLTVERAARAAHIHDFILDLPQGYDTVIGERGIRLSGGQRQRIGIARALYADPDVLILDEATSALDGATEDIVMDAIRRLSGERTLIIIAHRLATVRDCDQVHVIQRGSITASGTYAELIASSEQFRRMAHQNIALASA
jgi:ATP-binding cassette, subfamily B, bacterial PglK